MFFCHVSAACLLIFSGSLRARLQDKQNNCDHCTQREAKESSTFLEKVKEQWAAIEKDGTISLEK